MSYDLFLSAGPGKKLSKKTFSDYFGQRARYNVGNEQAVYQNEDTGVYFIFDEPEDGIVAFNLNYLRPHVFGLEAALELEQFSEAFAATVGDPQGFMEEGAGFQTELFLQGWNEGNQMAYGPMLKEQSEPIYCWPSQRIREIWDWNYRRPSEEDQQAEGLFVPSIFAVGVDGVAKSVAIWPPDCAILLPETDFLLVPLTQADQPGADMALVDWTEVAPVVSAYQQRDSGLNRYRLRFEQWPEPIAEFLTKQRTAADSINGISLDQVLDQELVEAS